MKLEGRLQEYSNADLAAPIASEAARDLVSDIGTSLEELRVAEDELRAFNAKLIETHEECEAEKRRYRELFDFCPDGYIVSTPDGVVFEANIAASNLLGLRREFLKGKPLMPFVARHDRPVAEERLAELLQGRRIEGWEVNLQDRSGRVFQASINAQPINDASGSATGIRWMIRDISKQKEAATVVEFMRERLQQSEQLSAIGTLAAGLGHDVKNLLFPLRCRLDSLAAVKLPGHAREHLDAIRQSIKYLQQLAANLQMLVEKPDVQTGLAAATHLPSWWEHVHPLLDAATPRRVSMSIRFQPNLPSLAIAPHLLTQALVNLVNNACAAIGEEGHITIWAELLEDEQRARLGISDDGPGLHPDELKRITDPHSSHRHGHGLSTGLGLPLVRKIVEQAGGSVAIDSSPGRGTNVILTLPIQDQESSAEETTDQPSSGPVAVISLADPHLSSSIDTLLNLWRLPGRRIKRLEEDPPDECALWITEPAIAVPARARKFLQREGLRRLVLIGSPEGSEWATIPAVWIKAPATPRIMRDALSEVVHDVLQSA